MLISVLLLIGGPAADTAHQVPTGAGSTLDSPAQTAQTAQTITPHEPVADAAAPPVDAVPTGPVPAPRRHAKGDPLEGFNRDMFGVHQAVDKAVFRPAGLGFKRFVPKPVRSGLRHFLVNLTEPIVFLSYMLQLKPGKAIETLARFSINSTLGLGGVLDVAKLPGVRLPHRDNGLGNTLGYYGVKPGPYIFLPLVGPSSLRDFLGGQGDGLVLPLAVGKPFDRLAYQLPKAVLTGLDLRAESDDELRTLLDGAVDPYATLRSAYQQSRQGDIDALHNRAPATSPAELGGDLADPAGGQGASAASAELADPMTDPAAVGTPPDPASTTQAPPKELSDPRTDPAGTTPKP